jgi:hypothetical protein
MHRFVRIDAVTWVHTSRIRAFDTDGKGFLARIWLDGEEGSRRVTQRLQIVDQDMGDGTSTEWPFVAVPPEDGLAETAEHPRHRSTEPGAPMSVNPSRPDRHRRPGGARGGPSAGNPRNSGEDEMG